MNLLRSKSSGEIVFPLVVAPDQTYTPDMKLALPALLLACAARAQAAPHTLVVRMTQGTRTYSHTMNLEEGARARFIGKPDGAEDRKMVVNTALERAGAAFSLDIQLELARADESQSFQVQTSVLMRPGQSLSQAECGDWKVELILDGKPGSSAPAKAAWTSGGLENYRLTTALAAPAANLHCRQVMKPGMQAGVAESKKTDGHVRGYVLHAVLARARDGSFSLQYRLEQAPLEVESQEMLSLGIKRSVPAGGGKLAFLVEGARRAAAPTEKNESPGIPLLR
jgi:hypothetical protein